MSRFDTRKDLPEELREIQLIFWAWGPGERSRIGWLCPRPGSFGPMGIQCDNGDWISFEDFAARVWRYQGFKETIDGTGDELRESIVKQGLL